MRWASARGRKGREMTGTSRSVPRGEAHERQLLVDWQTCGGRGLCHELLPELISLDDWGYPVIAGAVPPELLGHAARAVRSCPQLALTLVTTAAHARGRAR
jgi:ferredoxin